MIIYCFVLFTNQQKTIVPKQLFSFQGFHWENAKNEQKTLVAEISGQLGDRRVQKSTDLKFLSYFHLRASRILDLNKKQKSCTNLNSLGLKFKKNEF
jgi:hypothetical protein